MANQDKIINRIKVSNEEYEINARYWNGKETLADLGLSAALKYCGITTTKLEDGSTVNPVIIDGIEHLATAGCVVFYENEEGTQEFVYNGSKWELLGKDLTYKVVQSSVSSPDVSGDATAFIDTISQDANGVITATKKNVKIPTPDWNAQKGEAGYIENRTHYIIPDKYIYSTSGGYAEIFKENFPKNIYYKGVMYDVPLNRKPNSMNYSELILGNNEIILTFDLDIYNYYREWVGSVQNNTLNDERIYYDVEVKHLPDIYISSSFVTKTDINNMFATNDDIDALFDINDYYNDYYRLTSETYSLRDNKSILYYTSDKMDRDFVVEQEYFENNKCLSHVYEENLGVGIITFSGEIPSKEEIQKQYMIEIDYIEYE